MSKFTCSLVLLAILGLGMAPSVAQAEGQIAVYFDALGTQRAADVSIGNVVLYVYGEGYTGFMSGAQYAVDYSPNLVFMTDFDQPPVFVGQSATGISVGFGLSPKPGEKFYIHSVFATWMNDCSAVNVNGPVVVPHPEFTDPTPMIARFPDQAVFPAFGARSQTCQQVGMDIKPGSCPNAFNANRWDFAQTGDPAKGGVVPLAILGSATVDVSMIDPATVYLEGVPHLGIGVDMEDLGGGQDGCDCNGNNGADGHMDLSFKFEGTALAAALPQAEVGETIEVTLTGNYLDGMPFEATDCITIVGNPHHAAKYGVNDDAELGPAYPNPFNPVTRFSYRVSSTQHVNIAIYDVAGRLVENLVNEVKGAGDYIVEWDAGVLPSGVYFYRMQAEGKTLVRRATLLK